MSDPKIKAGDDWRGKAYSFFCNKECEAFPCHETEDRDNFNCMFCYCPLYALGDRCGGNHVYAGRVKDCSGCVLPHGRESYGYIIQKFGDILDVMDRSRDEPRNG